MKRKPKLAPRNPLVAASLFRKAGSHDKPYKAQRRADKMVIGAVAHGLEQLAFTQSARVRASPAPPSETPDTWHRGRNCRVGQLFAVSIP